jgi:acyl carrier protein
LDKLQSEETKSIEISKIISTLVKEGASLEGRDFVLATLGLDSLQVIHLIRNIKKTFNVLLNYKQILDDKASVRSLATVVDDALAGISGEQSSSSENSVGSSL